MQMYNNGIQLFKIGESTLAFRAEDVALVIGMPYEGDVISFKHHKEQSIFKQMYLNKMHNRYWDVLKANFLRLVSSKDGKEETFIKLLVVYLMTTILFH